MNGHRLELPAFDQFAVSFDQLLQNGAGIQVEKGDPKRRNHHIIIDPEKFRQQTSWLDIPSPSIQSSFKEIEEPARPPLYKDRRRLITFIGLMLAWLFVSLRLHEHRYTRLLIRASERLRRHGDQ